jgi:hypothetical protein
MESFIVKSPVPEVRKEQNPADHQRREQGLPSQRFCRERVSGGSPTTKLSETDAAMVLAPNSDFCRRVPDTVIFAARATKMAPSKRIWRPPNR